MVQTKFFLRAYTLEEESVVESTKKWYSARDFRLEIEKCMHYLKEY